MITGVHAIVFSPDAEKIRAFFADVLELPSADAGGSKLVSACPLPSMLFTQPTATAAHELYLMCDDIHATLAGLQDKVKKSRAVYRIRAGELLAPRSACRTARSSPSTSPGTLRPANLTKVASSAAAEMTFDPERGSRGREPS